MGKPHLNPSAQAFVPSFGADLASWAQAQQPTAKQKTTGAAADAAGSPGRVGSPGRAAGHGRGAPSQSQGAATASADKAAALGQRLPGPDGGAASRLREPAHGSRATASDGVPADGTTSGGTVKNRSTSGNARSGQSRAGRIPPSQPQPPSSSLTSAISRGVTAAPGTAPPNAWTGASRPAHPGAPPGVTSAGVAARSAAAAALGRSTGGSFPPRGGGAPSGVLPPLRRQVLGSGAPLTQTGLREHTRSAGSGGAWANHSRVTQSAFQNGQTAVQPTVQGTGGSHDSAGGNHDGNGDHVGTGDSGLVGGDRQSRRTSAGVKLARPQPVAFGATGLAARMAPKKQESWTTSAVRRAIGSDSGDLEFDDLFDGGSAGGRTPTSAAATASGGGGALQASLSLESPSAVAAAAAALANAQSLEEALNSGGMLATSYVDVDGEALSAVNAEGDGEGGGAQSVSAHPPPIATPRAVESEPLALGTGGDAPCTPPGQVAMRASDIPLSPSKVSPADFEVLKVVGQGAFGKVFQVRKRDTGRIYAMKVMRKDRILARDHTEYVRAERDVLTSVRHPYIVMLHWSFQTTNKLYLVLDFVNGGHLFFNLYRAGIFDESQARLYTAEIVAAISHLHDLHIVHRDLKPENVLLDSQGHIRITDFGLAKSVPEGGRSNSLIGTMEYMAPEIISGAGHDKGVDWWSTGVLLYEQVCGITPFRSKDKSALKRMITQQKLKFTKNADGYLSQEAKSLVRALLEKDPKKRLGHGPGGGRAVKAHPFFRSINWAALEGRQIPSPYCPRTSGIECVENFDKLWTDRTPEDSPVGTPTTTPFGNSFRGFTYVAPSFLNSPPASPAQA